MWPRQGGLRADRIEQCHNRLTYGLCVERWWIDMYVLRLSHVLQYSSYLLIACDQFHCTLDKVVEVAHLQFAPQCDCTDDCQSPSNGDVSCSLFCVSYVQSFAYADQFAFQHLSVWFQYRLVIIKADECIAYCCNVRTDSSAIVSRYRWLRQCVFHLCRIMEAKSVSFQNRRQWGTIQLVRRFVFFDQGSRNWCDDFLDDTHRKM